MILEYLSDIKPEKFKPSSKGYSFFECTDRPAYTSVDWLRVTNPSLKSFDAFIKKFLPLLRGVGFRFVDTGGGLNGYTNCWVIQYEGENCGHVAADSNDKMGGMFELSGLGCQLMQVRWDMWCFLMAGCHEYGFRIKRLDTAVDFKGSIWDKFGFTMVDFAKAYKSGMFVIGSGSGTKPTHSTPGDWLDLLLGDGGTYDPRKQCPSGLTLNIGKATSGNSWCIYEKGKQLAGKNPDRYDGSFGSWVRVERRFSCGTGKSKREIPFDFALRPDESVLYGCAGFESFVSGWLDFQASEGVDVPVIDKVGIDVNRVGLMKGVSIKKTVKHVASHCGRVFKTLEDIGIDLVEFVNLVKRDEGVKGFDVGIYNAFSVSAGDDVMTFLRGQYA